MRRPLLALLTSVLVLGTFVHAAPAGAESGHRSKEVGNAPAAIDITAIDANNAQRRVKITLTVPGLSDQGKFTFGYEGRYYDGMAIVVRKRAGTIEKKAFHCGEESCTKVKCSGTKIDWNTAGHYIRASIPQSCYPLRIPKSWNVGGISDLGDEYDDEYTKLKLRRG